MIDAQLKNTLISGGVNVNKKPSRYTLMGRACYKLRYGNEEEKEKEREYLIKNKLITMECLKCFYFLGNYKGIYRNGEPIKKEHNCRGRKSGNCLYYEEGDFNIYE